MSCGGDKETGFLQGEKLKKHALRFKKAYTHWCTLCHENNLAKNSIKKPAGYRKKYTLNKNIKKSGRYAVSKKQNHSKNVDYRTHDDTGENKQVCLKNTSKQDLRAGEKSFRVDGTAKKRGRPKILPGGIKKNRERPKFTNSKRKVPLESKVIAKKQMSKSPKRNNYIKKKSRPRHQETENELLYYIQHTYANSGTFVQTTRCFTHKDLLKCLECCKASNYKTTRDMQLSCCRFLEYRKLFASTNRNFSPAGFLQMADCTENDKCLWSPNTKDPPTDLTIEASKQLLFQVGNQFCDLIQEEKTALSLHVGRDKNMTWKKLVKGVREMCDVCDTTLFNIHWMCPLCGFAVCIDCYKDRQQPIIIEDENPIEVQNNYKWLLCHNEIPHYQSNLIISQIIPGDILWTTSQMMHAAREKCNIAAYCKCTKTDANSSQNYVDTIICNKLTSKFSNSSDNLKITNKHPLPYFRNSDIPNCFYNMDEADAAREKTEESLNLGSLNGMPSSSFDDENEENKLPPILEILEPVIKPDMKMNKSLMNDALNENNSHYLYSSDGYEPLLSMTPTSVKSRNTLKHAQYSWLCDGRLLLLHRPDHHENLGLFQECWKRGQPIMVMAVNKKLNMSLWHPDEFSNEFGNIKNDLVNCKTGNIIPDIPMRKFWNGFANFSKRMKDDSGDYMLLKLKDWPPGEDFSERLPKRFEDLIKGLPLPEYTHRDGIFNLAGRLPSWFVKPDLGPKMYNAYGSALFPSTGTTNLHLDVSDAVNVLLYVGIPTDDEYKHHIDEALKAIDEGGCDSLTKERVRGMKPGALWHIYESRDADKIRKFLAKVAVERGEHLEGTDDPIHDQTWYLDEELRHRLYSEYGVEGYAIAQCLGDAIFIPAGAPHQVRNLHSCMKIAEDFVSPENIAHCFKLTQEFRKLSKTHMNHEDKLQIKNIIYHVVKDSVSHLLKNDFV